MNTRAVTAHIPIELAEALDKIAMRIDRPKGWIIKQALTVWVELEEERRRLTLEGLADVEANRVVEHATLKTWVANLDKPVDSL
ncbi:predicted transcriptional regulator [Nitrosomonas sp. PY1]|uniref:CopG family ribbon-helix-helix protein n=1 Tax=Nitrosomonas sp. PY1 TaxID=1803906 RepID=UPI001FC86B40|nr:ribbon-helix-helix domain-containing protein [Nitrosomonas sp. PY1]GKS68578.1 predicted transcriptional regulator [Nitrosomonas sp. PY1]